MKTQSTATSRKFHFMVAAQILFTLKEGEQTAINTATVNAVVTHDKDVVPARLLGKAQQAAQMQFIKKLGEEAPNVQVADVVVLNLMNLGYMSDDEFAAAPEGQKQQEVAKAKPGLSVVGGTKATSEAANETVQ
jgi:hypothetical protein